VAFSKTEKIGLFGGTFNPVHIGHTEAARLAVERLGLDKLIFIPTLNPPHKELPESSASAETRLEMLKLASKGMESVEVSDIEISRGGISYTADTIKELQKLYPGAEFWLLMGNDMLCTFESWRSIDWLVKNISICALSRHSDKSDIELCAKNLEEKYGVEIVFAHNSAIDISSSQLRQLLKQREGREYLNEDVYAFIVKNRLYGVKPDFDWLREKATAMLSASRTPHVLGCEQEAVSLAARWGADEDDARSAAILHDITKKLTLNEQLILCKKYDIMTDTAESSNVKLLHSKTGAAIARDIFGMPEQVCDAIKWHTTGRPGMSLLERIIYIADYIEPGRNFPGVDVLRRNAYTDLDKAVLMGLEMSIESVKEEGQIPHPNTLLAIEYLKRSIKA
jgi:nicotinate-nucleotide adenylyltransferase